MLHKRHSWTTNQSVPTMPAIFIGGTSLGNYKVGKEMAEMWSWSRRLGRTVSRLINVLVSRLNHESESRTWCQGLEHIAVFWQNAMYRLFCYGKSVQICSMTVCHIHEVCNHDDNCSYR